MLRNIVLAFSVCALWGMTAGHAVAGEKVKVAVICKAMDSEFWQTVKNGASEAANELGNVELTVMAPDREVNVQQQVQIVEDSITQKVDVIALAPCGSKELIPAMERAKAAGIPVIVFDTDSPWDGKACFIGTNEIKGGSYAGEYIAKALDGKGKVAFIGGVMGHQTSIDRLAGCEEVLAKYPGISIVAKQPANSERALAMTVMENILTSHPDLGAVFAINAEMAMGCVEAVLAEGAKTLVVGYYQERSALQAIKDGQMAGLVYMSPFGMGKLSVETAVKINQGETVPARIDTPMGFVDKNNVDEWLK